MSLSRKISSRSSLFLSQNFMQIAYERSEVWGVKGSSGKLKLLKPGPQRRDWKVFLSRFSGRYQINLRMERCYEGLGGRRRDGNNGF